MRRSGLVMLQSHLRPQMLELQDVVCEHMVGSTRDMKTRTMHLPSQVGCWVSQTGGTDDCQATV